MALTEQVSGLGIAHGHLGAVEVRLVQELALLVEDGILRIEVRYLDLVDVWYCDSTIYGIIR